MNEDIQSRLKEFDDIFKSCDADFREWLCTNGYFTAPASTKYHGNYIGGLFEHSLAVARVLSRLTKDCFLNWQNERSPVVIGLFHDLCKIDQYKTKEQKAEPNDISDLYEYRSDMLLKGHGDKSVMMLASHMQLTEEEVMCIRYHMGAFTEKSEWSDYTRAIHKYPNVLWTHHADMIAAHIFDT